MVGKLKMIGLALVLVLAGLAPLGLAAESDAAPAFQMVLELEDFTIQSGQIVEHKDASNGKAVIADAFDFTASKTLNLTQKGVYEITLFENAPNGASDAINISVNDEGALRTYPNEATDMNKFAACIKKYLFTVNQPGDFNIKVFTSNEKGALYDRILIALIKAQ
jgi:hypothetical protein